MEEVAGMEEMAIMEPKAVLPQHESSKDPKTLQRMLEDLQQHRHELQQQNEELQRTHHELGKATEKFRDLWNHAPVGYVSHNRNGLILAANERARTLLEKAGELHDESTLQGFLGRHSRLVLRQHLWMVAESPQMLPAEIMLNTQADGPECWVRIETTSAGPGEFRSALIDISEVKRAEAERLEMASQLRHSQKMDVLHELSAGIAHDFNNILQVVMAYAELIRSDLQSDGKNVADVTALIRGAERGADLTRRLLAFSRKSSLEASQVDLRRVVGNAAEVVKRTVGETIRVELSVSNTVVPVEVDSTLIEQAVMNLCLNARDAMPDGGQLIIDSHRTEFQTEVLMNGNRLSPGQYGVICIADDGMGMDEHVMEKIFEPFFTTKRLGSGTGLGLSIVYGVIRQHGGAISVKSFPGDGTKFEIYLPLLASMAPHRSPVADVTVRSTRHKGGRILLAEDEKCIREVIARCLEMDGYLVTAVADGREAIRVLRTDPERFDLLLTDAVMPHASGKDVCEVYQKIPGNGSVIMLTGHGDSVIDKAYLEDRQATLLTKPIQSKSLLNKVSDAINAARSR